MVNKNNDKIAEANHELKLKCYAVMWIHRIIPQNDRILKTEHSYGIPQQTYLHL